MKTKKALQIDAMVADRDNYRPLPDYQTLRAASLQLGRPLEIYSGNAYILFYPKGLKGKFARVSIYQPHYATGIVPMPKTEAEKNRYDYVREIPRGCGVSYDPIAGSWLQAACDDVADLVNHLHCRIELKFNDVEQLAKPGCTGASLYANHQAISDANYQRYLASDKYKESQRKAEERRVKEQAGSGL